MQVRHCFVRCSLCYESSESYVLRGGGGFAGLEVLEDVSVIDAGELLVSALQLALC
jgi:hypothetical protein